MDPIYAQGGVTVISKGQWEYWTRNLNKKFVPQTRNVYEMHTKRRVKLFIGLIQYKKQRQNRNSSPCGEQWPARLSMWIVDWSLMWSGTKYGWGKGWTQVIVLDMFTFPSMTKGYYSEHCKASKKTNRSRYYGKRWTDDWKLTGWQMWGWSHWWNGCFMNFRHDAIEHPRWRLWYEHDPYLRDKRFALFLCPKQYQLRKRSLVCVLAWQTDCVQGFQNLSTEYRTGWEIGLEPDESLLLWRAE